MKKLLLVGLLVGLSSCQVSFRTGEGMALPPGCIVTARYEGNTVTVAINDACPPEVVTRVLKGESK